MRLVSKTGNPRVATVYLAETSEGKLIEFVESLQPPFCRDEKWVLIISTLYGCPVGCRFCDAGNYYQGKISKQDLFDQIDYLVKLRFPDGHVPSKKFKIQLARMGEPALNNDIPGVLEELTGRYDAPGLLPTLSTTAPAGRESFFEKLLDVKERIYPDRFQLQFSIHTTDAERRAWLIPVPIWRMEQISAYGVRFHESGGRKVTLNFAASEGSPVDPAVLRHIFDPDHFLIKLTPLNPTAKAQQEGLCSRSFDAKDFHELIDSIRKTGFEVIVSVGEQEENLIGSNCGQYISHYLKSGVQLEEGYIYRMQPVGEIR